MALLIVAVILSELLVTQLVNKFSPSEINPCHFIHYKIKKLTNSNDNELADAGIHMVL
jgi:hypothetical protein